MLSKRRAYSSKLFCEIQPGSLLQQRIRAAADQANATSATLISNSRPCAAFQRGCMWCLLHSGVSCQAKRATQPHLFHGINCNEVKILTLTKEEDEPAEGSRLQG